MCPENQCDAILFLPTSMFTDDITTVMNSYWINSVFTLELKHSAPSRVSLICTCPGLAHVMMFCPKFLSVKAGRQQI